VLKDYLLYALFFSALYALSFAGLRRYQRSTVRRETTGYEPESERGQQVTSPSKERERDRERERAPLGRSRGQGARLGVWV